jgi:hypothetical protein
MLFLLEMMNENLQLHRHHHQILHYSHLLHLLLLLNNLLQQE